MTIELKISGMNCQHCVAAVTRALAGVPGVDDVSVDLATAMAQVSGAADVDALITAIVAAGYSAERV